MGLESGTYIDSLVTTWPQGGDKKSTIGAHLRLIKSTLLNTFPNFSGELSASPTELNYLVGVTSTITEKVAGKMGISATETATTTAISPTSTLDINVFGTAKNFTFFRVTLTSGASPSVIYGTPDVNSTTALFAYKYYFGQNEKIRLYNNTSATLTVTYDVRTTL